MQDFNKIAILLIILVASGCSILNHSDSEKKIRDFVGEFEKSLSGTDAQILALFNSQQSQKAILAAVRVLQNKDSLHVRCHAEFDRSSIVQDSAGIRVVVGALISVDTLGFANGVNTTFTLYLKPLKGKLVIGRLGGEELFDNYVAIKNQMISALTDQQEEKELYTNYYAAVALLKPSYDSIVWAAHYHHKSYFYVVKGQWSEERNTAYSMGLVDKDGKVIVPVDYDLIGTPGIAVENIVEVKKNGLVGYYSLDGDSLIGAGYEFIIPYSEGGIYALAKKDGEFGWINSSHVFTAGLPDQDARAYVTQYKYLQDITLSATTPGICEIPFEANVGSGVLMPPSYMVANGFFRDVEAGFATGGMFRANVESMSVSTTFMSAVSGKISALVSVISGRYLEGRDGFYSNNEIDFVNENGEIIATSKNEIQGELSINSIDSSLLEIRAVSEPNIFEPSGLTADQELNVPRYWYYRIVDGQAPELLSSNRWFAFTEFLKMDESYVSGSFQFWNPDTQQMEKRSYLSNSTLTSIRNEILASYGYIFPDEETSNHYKYYQWYHPTYSSLEDFRGQLSEIDAYNLDFLEKLIGPPQAPS